MSSMEREHSLDRDLVRHHGSSFSSMDRTIPMYVLSSTRAERAIHTRLTCTQVG